MQILNDCVRDTSNIIASTSAAGFLASNLNIDKKSSTWKSTSNATQTISITWGSAVDVNAVSLIHHNFDENTIARVKYFDNASNPIPIYDSGNISTGVCFDPPSGFLTNSGNSFTYGGGNYLVNQSATYAVRKIEIQLMNDTPDHVYEIARIVAGNATSLNYGAESAAIEFIDDNESVRTEAGDTITNAASCHKKMSLSFGTLSISDRRNLINIFRKVGTRVPVLVMSRGYKNDGIDKSLMVYGRLSESSLDLIQRYYSSTAIKVDEY